jgi:MFS family permease
MSTLGLDRLRASQLNMLLPVGVIVGAPCIGWLVDRIVKNKFHVFNGLLALLTSMWFLLALGGERMGWQFLTPLLFLMGVFAGGFASTLWAIVRETTQSHIFGLISGLLNPSPFIGVAVLQPITGAVIDRIERVGNLYPPAAFRDAFLLCALIMLGCLLLSVIFRKTLAQSNKER